MRRTRRLTELATSQPATTANSSAIAPATRIRPRIRLTPARMSCSGCEKTAT